MILFYFFFFFEILVTTQSLVRLLIKIFLLFVRKMVCVVDFTPMGAIDALSGTNAFNAFIHTVESDPSLKR